MEKAPDNSQEFRFERKIVVSSLKKYEIESVLLLHPAMFSEIYYERYVNNIYFDALNMKNYFDNIDGVGKRFKVRIRWYGDLFGTAVDPSLEIKIKDGLVGRKERFKLCSFLINEGLTQETITDVICKCSMPDILKKDLTALRPVLLNRYRRKYFLSANRNYRVTIDTCLEFYRINTLSNAFMQKSTDSVNTVVEVKYDRGEDDDVNWLFNYLPFRIDKNSKYVSGIERMYSF